MARSLSKVEDEIKSAAEEEEEESSFVDRQRREASASNERKVRERNYLQQLDVLEETGTTLREAWSDIMQSSQRQIEELRCELEVRRLERDESRRNLREAKERCARETGDLVHQLSEAKMTLAELALEVDQITLRLRQCRRALETTAAKSSRSDDSE